MWEWVAAVQVQAEFVDRPHSDDDDDDDNDDDDEYVIYILYTW